MPHWFPSGDDWCAATWHPAAGVASRVAVLCPSIAQEQLRGSRDYRVLAGRLASAGVSVLRFDYPATGNSTGDAIAPTHPGADRPSTDLVDRWCASIQDAASAALRRAPGAELVLIGRRLGALLVAKASAAMPKPPAACVLWEPSSSGTAHLRELRLRESARLDVLFAPELDRVDPGIALQTEGHRFDATTVAAICGLTLDSLRPRALQVHVVGLTSDRATRAIAGWGEGAGAPSVHVHPTSDAAFDWAHPEGPRLPTETLDVIERLVHPPRGIDVREDGAPVSTDALSAITLLGAGLEIRQTLLRFGADQGCFGVHTAPIDEARVTCVLLILGTGIEPTPGFGDAWARFAPRAAARGVAVLRMDYRGNGESVAHAGRRENVSYQAGRVDDVREGVEWLRGRWPGARIVVAGICTGAYYGIHAAAEGVAIDRVIAVNPQLWCTDDSTIDQVASEALILARRSTAAAGDVGKWMRLLRGGYCWTDVSGAVHGLLSRGIAAVREIGRASGTLGGGMPRLDLARLFPSSVEFHLVFSPDDAGYEHLLAHGARKARRLFAQSHITLHTIRGVDHTFSRDWMRRQLDDELLRLLDSR